jgi:ferrochelatase
MSKKAIVFLNMGAPKDLDEVELFLKNMFNDKNIITVKSNLLRSFIASRIIKGRKKEAKESYDEIGGRSPLLKHTETFLKKIKEEFPEHIVINIMRYTPPYAVSELRYLKAKGVEDITLIPLYPQYSTTTVKSSLDDFYEALQETKYRPNLRVYTRFYKNRNYNQAIIEEIKKALKDRDSKEFDLIFSAHSLPVKIIKNGDSYQEEIIDNVEILKSMLKEQDIEFENIHLAYQSKVGPQQWLEPSLDDKLKELENRKVIIYPISFILDNSETEFELDIEYREIAKELGIKEYIVAKCLNENSHFIKTVKELVLG